MKTLLPPHFMLAFLLLIFLIQLLLSAVMAGGAMVGEDEVRGKNG